jgi:diaminohydroxyphosphoribosylaminopyrimidine deaminase/5-amino-6-(5-phosphoribosylamino)uracil reductase
LIERALQLAKDCRWLSPPNPSVGCVIVGNRGEILGEGHTQHVGGPHAEIMALRNAETRGLSVQDATAYVTLEPCCHFGRTGPCCDALIDAGVKKVVASIADPNPIVSGQGFTKLAAAGVEVVIGPGAAESRELNIGFFSRMIRKTPWVRLKVAASMDGRTALNNGVSQWITSPQARVDGHHWRARACAVLTGIGTVKADDPRLDVRLAGVSRQPHLVVIDSRLETPLDASLFDAGRSVLIYGAENNGQKRSGLESRGATVIYCPGLMPGTENRIDLKAMLQNLAQREVNEVHVEAGPRLNGALLRAGLVDEIVFYVAPKLMGEGLGIANLGTLTSLDEAVSLNFSTIDQIGPDLRIVVRLNGADSF